MPQARSYRTIPFEGYDMPIRPRTLFARTFILLAKTAAVGCLIAASASSQAQNANLGASIATKGTSDGVAACVTCHGAKGEGNAASGFPRLAGLSVPYMTAQLEAYASGKRQNPVMQPFAKLLSDPQRKAVALYFNKLPYLAGKYSEEDQATPQQTGAWLVMRGRWDDGLPACVQCHGPGGIGVGTAFPPLAGQPAGYIENQLHAFKNGTRPPGPLNLMTVVVSKMSDSDIKAVADHFGTKQVAAANAGTKGKSQ